MRRRTEWQITDESKIGDQEERGRKRRREATAVPDRCGPRAAVGSLTTGRQRVKASGGISSTGGSISRNRHSSRWSPRNDRNRTEREKDPAGRTSLSPSLFGAVCAVRRASLLVYNGRGSSTPKGSRLWFVAGSSYHSRGSERAISGGSLEGSSCETGSCGQGRPILQQQLRRPNRPQPARGPDATGDLAAGRGRTRTGQLNESHQRATGSFGGQAGIDRTRPTAFRTAASAAHATLGFGVVRQQTDAHHGSSTTRRRSFGYTRGFCGETPFPVGHARGNAARHTSGTQIPRARSWRRQSGPSRLRLNYVSPWAAGRTLTSYPRAPETSLRRGGWGQARGGPEQVCGDSARNTGNCVLR